MSLNTDLQARWELVLVQYDRVTEKRETAYRLYYEHFYDGRRVDGDITAITQLDRTALRLAEQMAEIAQQITSRHSAVLGGD